MIQATLSVSQCIEALQALRAQHGDVPIYIDDADAYQLLGFTVDYGTAETRILAGYSTLGEEGVGEAIILRTEYVHEV